MKSLYLRLWKHISSYRRKQLLMLLFLMLLASFAEVFSISASIPFLGALIEPDRVLSNSLAQPLMNFFQINNSKQLIFLLTVFFIFAVIVSSVIRIILLYAQIRISHGIGADLSTKIYDNTLHQPYAVHVSRNSSHVIATIIEKANSVIYSSLLPWMTIISSCFLLGTIMAALIAVDARIALSSFCGFAVIYISIAFVTKKRLALDSQRITQNTPLVFKALQEGLGGIRDILIDGLQALYSKIYRDADLPLRRSQANIHIIGGAPRFLIEALSLSFIATLAYHLAISQDGIADSIPVLGALAIGAQRMLPAMQQLFSSWAGIRGGKYSLIDVVELLEQEKSGSLCMNLENSISFQNAIELKDVSFRYDSNSPWVLKNLNIKIPKGSRVGIMGPTGGGKSTFLDILMGLLEPTDGSLLIDDLEITSLNNRAWQMQLAHVPQSIFLNDATIEQNIAFGVPTEKINSQLVRDAAKKAQLSETINSWKDEYKTMVGERGVRLSGGQRQRIGIARAFYKQANVIIFDEATSALDNDTEKAVMDAIESISKDITLIVVAHRLSTLDFCDEIIKIDSGLVEISQKN
jgi:ABC-type multidrug transport system fused ATPase/permease subunit